MQDFIGLGIIIIVAACAFYGLARISQKEELTQEEYDKRRAQSHGTFSSGMTASMTSLQELLQPKAAGAVAVQRDLQHGYYNVKQKKADGGTDADSSVGRLTKEGEER